MNHLVFVNFQYCSSDHFYEDLLSYGIGSYNIAFISLPSESILFKSKNLVGLNTIIFAYAASPFNDSKELYDRIRAIDPQSPVIICSESSTPLDVRTCFLCGFSDFLLTPFTMKELEMYVNRLSSMDSIDNSETAMESTVTETTKDDRLVNEDLIRSLVNEAHVTSIKSAKVKHDLLANRFKLFAISNAEINLNVEDYIDQSYNNAIQQYLDILYQHFDDEYPLKVYSFEFVHTFINNRLCLVFYSRETDQLIFEKQIQEFLGDVVESFYYHTNYTTNVGIGDCFQDMQLMSKEYLNATLALQNRFFKRSQDQHIFKYLETPDYYPADDEDLQTAIDKSSKTKGLDSFYEIYEQLLCSFEKKQTPPAYVKRAFITLFNKFIYDNISISYNAKSKMYFKHNIEKAVELIGNVYDLIKYFAKLIDELLYHTYSVKGTLNDTIVKAEAYILENYEKQISLHNLAEHLSINPNYLSELFKKYSGMNFLAYLTQIRMLNAKTLLANTDKKIYEIGEEVGYQETVSFTRAFIRYEGISPRQYRVNLSTQSNLSE